MMSRIIKLWCIAKPIASELSAKGVCVWNPDGQSFTLKWQHIRGRVIKLDDFRHYVIAEADRLKQFFSDLAPYLDFSSIMLSQLMDDAESPNSLFDRADNRHLFDPFIQQIWSHLGRHRETAGEKSSSLFSVSGSLKKARAWSWLEQQQEFLLLVVTHLCRTVGIPPRAWQISQLLYQPLGGYLRNLRLIRGTVLISHPKAKQRDRLMYNAFWALPTHLGRILVIYLGVFRSVVVELLQLLGADTREHQHYIFVRSSTNLATSPYSAVFSSSMINGALREATPELAYEIRVYRHVIQAIYDNQLSHLPSRAIRKLLDNADHKQAQHSSTTHDTHYARDEIAHGAGVQLSMRNSQLAISRLFHAWYGFVPAELTWDALSSDAVPSTISNNLLFALGVARQRVLIHYALSGSDHVRCAEQVSKLMDLKPFLLGNNVSLSSSCTAVD